MTANAPIPALDSLTRTALGTDARSRRPFGLALAAATAFVLAGCFGSGPSASDGGGGDDTPDAGGDAGMPDADTETPPAFTNGVSTLAGVSVAGDVDGPRDVVRFSNPVNVAYRNGVLYVADFDNGKLRAIDLATNVTSTIVGLTEFQRPFGLAFAPDGTLYVSTDNDAGGGHSPTSGTIWRVDVAAKTATVVANAIGRPRGIAVMTDGRIAAADYLHHVVEIVDPADGQVTVIAGVLDQPGYADGVGSAARFTNPYGIVVRGDGAFVVTDYGNDLLRLVAPDGSVSAFAGAPTPGYADGALADARFSRPQGLSMANDGSIYLTDTGNFRVRRIVGGQVETVAGDGVGGYLDGDDLLAARLYGLEGLSIVPDGSMLYVADGNRGEADPYNRVRQVILP